MPLGGTVLGLDNFLKVPLAKSDKICFNRSRVGRY